MDKGTPACKEKAHALKARLEWLRIEFLVKLQKLASDAEGYSIPSGS